MGLIKSIGRLVKKAAPIAAGFATGGATNRLFGGARPTTVGRAAFLPSSTVRRTPALPTRRGFTGPSPTRPAPGAGNALARALPGGRTGLLYAPYDLNTPTDRMGRPVAVVPAATSRISCPSGYVAVDLDGDGVKDACVLKPVARAMGLYKSRPKPPVSGYEARAVATAKSVRTRLKKLAQSTGLHVYDNPRASTRKKGGKK